MGRSIADGPMSDCLVDGSAQEPVDETPHNC